MINYLVVTSLFTRIPIRWTGALRNLFSVQLIAGSVLEARGPPAPTPLVAPGVRGSMALARIRRRRSWFSRARGCEALRKPPSARCLVETPMFSLLDFFGVPTNLFVSRFGFLPMPDGTQVYSVDCSSTGGVSKALNRSLGAPLGPGAVRVPAALPLPLAPLRSATVALLAADGCVVVCPPPSFSQAGTSPSTSWHSSQARAAVFSCTRDGGEGD